MDAENKRLRELGLPEKPNPASASVVQLPPPVLTDHGGEQWHSVRDCIAELLRDIDLGVVKPEMVYVALRSEEEPDGSVSYPSYCYSGAKENGLLMLGLVARHQAKIVEIMRGD